MKITGRIGLLLITSILLISCSHKKSEKISSDSITLELHSSSVGNLVSEPQYWHYSDNELVVLFGYGFNDSEYVEKTVASLENKYGLAENGGLINPLVFPDSFVKSRRFDTAFYSELTDTEKEVKGIILLGAPEYTNRALGRNIDFWKQNVPYSVISLFPQDDISGMQGTCDLVIDKTQETDIAESIPEEETENQEKFDYYDILTKTLDFVLAVEGPLPMKEKLTLKDYAQTMLPGYELHAYIDPETGIQFKNHFILK